MARLIGEQSWLDPISVFLLFYFLYFFIPQDTHTSHPPSFIFFVPFLDKLHADAPIWGLRVFSIVHPILTRPLKSLWARFFFLDTNASGTDDTQFFLL